MSTAPREILCIAVKQHGNSFDLKPIDTELGDIIIIGTIPGKLRRRRIMPNDTVKVRLSGYFSNNNKPIGVIIEVAGSTNRSRPKPK